MRSDVSLSTIIRVLTRLLEKKKQESESDDQQDLLWNYEKAFTNKTCDFMIDESGKPLNVVAKEEVIIEDNR